MLTCHHVCNLVSKNMKQYASFHQAKFYVCIVYWVIMSMTYYNSLALCKLKICYKMCQLFESWMLKGIKLSRNLLRPVKIPVHLIAAA